MTTARRGPGWIYVTNWDGKDGLQHYHDRWPSWIKLHLKLLGSDAWIELSPEDRCLLMTIWMLTGRYGQGRVKASLRWLQGQANLPLSNRYQGLERLSHAGFITIKSRRALEPVYPKRTREGSKEPKEKERARTASSVTAAAARSDTETNGHEPERDQAVAAAGLEILGKALKAVP